MKRINLFFPLLTCIYEVFMLSGFILLVSVVLYSIYGRYQTRCQIVQSFSSVGTLLESLEIYSLDNPKNQKDPLPNPVIADTIELCSVKEPDIQNSTFLTTPVAYLKTPAIDPFMTYRTGGKPKQTPMMLHWVRPAKMQGEKRNGNKHIGWGTFSVGPSLRITHAYNISVFKKVPFQTKPLRDILYDPSNGLTSYGLIYKDSLGNTSIP